MEMITINKNIKKLLFIFLLIFSVFLFSCNKRTQETKIKTETNVTEEYYLTYIVDKQEVSTIIVSVNEDIVLKEMPEKSEYIYLSSLGDQRTLFALMMSDGEKWRANMGFTVSFRLGGGKF